MGWAKRHPLERIVVTGSIAVFAGGIGFAVWMLSGSPVWSVVAVVAGGLSGHRIVVRFGEDRGAREPAFEVQPIEPRGGDDVLLLEDVLAPDTLWLDDPLPSPERESRVVRLFAAHPPATPGELVERISDFLGDAQGKPTPGGPPIQSAPDASAELYAALANIRASLR